MFLNHRAWPPCGVAWLLALGAVLYCGAEESAALPDPIAWLSETQRAPREFPAFPLAPLLADQSGQPVTELKAWSLRRGELLDAWREVLRPLAVDVSQPPALTVLEEVKSEGVLRQRIRYETEPGQQVEAYLIRPVEAKGRRPGVVVFHSTVHHSIDQPAGLGSDLNKAFGWKLAQQGVVTLSPRNFLWPVNDRISAKEETAAFLKRNPQSTGMARMLLDAQLAVTILAHDPDVDPSRLGCVGHSLGAKEVLYLAAFDDRVKVTVSSEGGVGIPFSNWDAEWYLGSQVHDSAFSRQHHELLALTAPRPFLLIGGDSADGVQSWPFIAAALPVYELFGQPAHLGLFNHGEGHAVPPIAEERIAEWMLHYLNAAR